VLWQFTDHYMRDKVRYSGSVDFHFWQLLSRRSQLPSAPINAMLAQEIRGDSCGRKGHGEIPQNDVRGNSPAARGKRRAKHPPSNLRVARSAASPKILQHGEHQVYFRSGIIAPKYIFKVRRSLWIL